MFLRGCCMTVFIAVLVCSGRLQAQSAEFDSIIGEGVREFAAGNFVEARSLFERAHALAPNARTLRALGLCAFELKRYTQAASELDAALKDPRKPLSAELTETVSETLVRAKRFIGVLHVVTEPADSQLRIDGTARVGRRFEVDAGDHVVVASAPGYESRELKVTVTGMQVQKVELVLPRVSGSSPATSRAESQRNDPANAEQHGSDVSPVAAARAGRRREDGHSVATRETQLPRGKAVVPRAECADPPCAGVADPSSRDQLGDRRSPADREPALTERWWFWTAIGAVVVAAGVSTAVAVNADNTKPYAGSSGVTLSAR